MHNTHSYTVTVTSQYYNTVCTIYHRRVYLTLIPLPPQIYPYLVLNDPQGSRCRSEERILQLLSMVNLFLEKDKVS